MASEEEELALKEEKSADDVEEKEEKEENKEEKEEEVESKEEKEEEKEDEKPDEKGEVEEKDEEEKDEPKEEEEKESPPETIEETPSTSPKLQSIPISSESPPPIVSNHARTSSHNSLRAYESCRRSSYTSKLNSSSLYWKSFRELIRSSVEETTRALHLIRARVLADETYAAHMQAISEDLLDEKGGAILDPKKRKKVLASRVKEEEKGLKDARSSERRGGMLRQLIESHGVLSDRYSENATAMKDDILPEMERLERQLSHEVYVMESLGDCILDELEAAEAEVVSAWDTYYESAVLSLSGKQIATRVGATDAGGEVDPSPVTFRDVWILEMHYRMSVAFLSACWEKCSTELSRLFANMKDTECNRRFRLRELLISFLQRQERLWLGLPSTIAPVLKDLVDRPMDRTSIEDDVQTSIRLRAQAIQREMRSSEPEEEKPTGLTGIDPSEGNFELSSPLLSSLLCRAKVVERRQAGMMSSWKTSLAVITADSFLHFFDIPSSLKITCGSAPEVAFYALVPPVTIPTEETIKSGASGSSLTIQKWNKHLVPSDSLILPNCKISFRDDDKNSAFEIVETVCNTGASKMFGRLSYKKVFLRTLTRDETRDWIGKLKNPTSGE